ncbi:MAG TPA: hypothetical protein VK789_03335 [Bryobacteraceae bacterium]|nr:hypothetical protein [Bryobacteraceae bacterium]
MHRVLHPVRRQREPSPPGGYISSRFSNLWEVETKRILKGPLFVREWSAAAGEFSHDKDFLEYMRRY